MIDTGIVLLGCCWLFYKFYRTKNSRPLIAGLMVFSLQFHYWPFYLPIQISFALVAFIAATTCFYELHVKKDKMFTLLAIVFLLFGFIFLSEIFLHQIVFKGTAHGET